MDIELTLNTNKFKSIEIQKKKIEPSKSKKIIHIIIFEMGKSVDGREPG